MKYQSNEKFALELDVKDPLASYRNKFYLPKRNDGSGKHWTYFLGNSLGLQPKAVKKLVNEELVSWKEFGIHGYYEGRRPWIQYVKNFTKKLAPIVGAKTDEVTLMNSLTVNIHFLLASFYQPISTRHKILIEKKAFSSDQYAIKSHIKWHGYDPQTSLIEVPPRPGESFIRTEDILETIKEEASSLALIFIGGINYYTGQAFDMKTITRVGHEHGCLVGFDLAHAVGNILLKLHDWEVDFAAWCTYKYLNGGPGSTAGIFVHERHNNTNLPRLAGWWGHQEESRFHMPSEFEPIKGAAGWQLSNTSILSLAPLLSSLEIFNEVGMEKIREKSIHLTGFLEFLLNRINSNHFNIITPSSPKERGAQISLLFPKNRATLRDASFIQKKLEEKGFLCDHRKPDVLRITPCPLYNRYNEVYHFVENLTNIL